MNKQEANDLGLQNWSDTQSNNSKRLLWTSCELRIHYDIVNLFEEFWGRLTIHFQNVHRAAQISPSELKTPITDD